MTKTYTHNNLPVMDRFLIYTRNNQMEVNSVQNNNNNENNKSTNYNRKQRSRKRKRLTKNGNNNIHLSTISSNQDAGLQRIIFKQT